MISKKGVSLIYVLVATIILIIGISCVLIILQQTENIYSRASRSQDFSVAADILFDQIQQEFGTPGIHVPDHIDGKMSGFKNIYYHIEFIKIKEGLYEIHIKLAKNREGKQYSEEFISALHQR